MSRITNPQGNVREQSSMLLIVIENSFLAILYGFFALAAFNTWRSNGNLQPLVIALQEALIVGLAIARRRSVEVSRSGSDVVIALAGTALPLLQRGGGLQIPALVAVGITIQITGAALSVLATWSLGRSFGILPANRGVQTGGFYRLVRHPLYGSYLVGYFGFLIGNLSLVNLALVGLTVLCQYLRARAEEQVLMRDIVYAVYAQRVRYRFIPFVL